MTMNAVAQRVGRSQDDPRASRSADEIHGACLQRRCTSFVTVSVRMSFAIVQGGPGRSQGSGYPTRVARRGPDRVDADATTAAAGCGCLAFRAERQVFGRG